MTDDTMMDDGMRTPTMRSINVADAYDWQHRANAAEQKLLAERAKLTREKRKTRRLQSQVQESVKGWTTCTQQCQVLTNSNYAFSQECQRLKAIIETLEHVIQRVFIPPRGRDTSASTSPGYETIDD
jgi:septal ring factor EnvC (AmiA/AmiB activator)